jgi:hypothetical protein
MQTESPKFQLSTGLVDRIKRLARIPTAAKFLPAARSLGDIGTSLTESQAESKCEFELKRLRSYFVSDFKPGGLGCMEKLTGRNQSSFNAWGLLNVGTKRINCLASDAVF